MNNLFVKDNGNLLSYNQWSVGEYNNNLSGFEFEENVIPSLSGEWACKGNKSLKTIYGGSSSLINAIATRLTGLSIGDSVTLTCKVLNTNIDSLELRLVSNVEGHYTTLQRVTIPISSEVQNIYISSSITEEMTNLIIGFKINAGTLFIDDFCLLKS